MGFKKHKRTATGSGRAKYLDNVSTTANTSDPDSDSGNDEGKPIPRTSKRTKYHATPPSCIDSNNELLKRNPFLIRNVLACLCENSSSQALFNYRLVGQHIWNELAVNVINQDKSVGVRLVKIVDPDRTDRKCLTRTGTGVLINIEELISTLQAGRLEKSTLTRIYLNSSITPNDLNTFLHLNGQNIRTLHYDGYSLTDLRQILQSCAKNLINLSLWRSWDDANKDENQGLYKNCDDAELATFQFPRLESIVIVSGELFRNYCKGINVCNPPIEFLSHVFQASSNLKSLSARLYDSFIIDSGLSFKNLTTLCLKFKIRIPQLLALCQVGLNLKTLRLERLFFASHEGELWYCYMTDPQWMEFRKALLRFIQTQADTLEYFAVSLLMQRWSDEHGHDSPLEQWTSLTGFPRMPHLQTFILNECSGKIPKDEFSHLFPKLRNLEIVKCRYRQVAGPPQPIIMDFPLQIPISPNRSIFVQNIRGIKPTMELAQIFPSVIELHIENEIPHELPNYWPKLKHLYYKYSCKEYHQTRILACIRQIKKFLVGISPEESETIEQHGQRIGIRELTNMELPRSRPSIFNLNELETFEFGFDSYEIQEPLLAPTTESALGVLITLGLCRMTHLEKINFVLEQKPRPNLCSGLPQKSLDELANTFFDRKGLNISTNCDESGKDPRKPMTKKWTMEMNLDHHKSEWKEIDGLFRDDPDICELGLPREVNDHEDAI